MEPIARTGEQVVEEMEADIERAIIEKLKEEASAEIPEDATQSEIVTIIGRREEARKELAIRGLLRLANDHTEADLRDAGKMLLKRFGTEKARCAGCQNLLNWSDNDPPIGCLPGFYCDHEMANNPKLCPMPRLVGRVWDIRPAWCPRWPAEFRAAMAQDPAAGNRQKTDCGQAWQRRTRFGLIALLLPALAIAALMLCRSCRGEEVRFAREVPQVIISEQLKDREEKGLAILRAYSHAVDLADDFRAAAKRDVGVQIPWQSPARYTIVLCRDRDELVRIYKKVLEGCPPETISMIERSVAFCAHIERRIYLSRLDAEDLRHELAHMLWPDDVLRTAYRLWPKEQRQRLADDEVLAAEAVAETFRVWVTRKYDADADKAYGIKIVGLKVKVEQPGVKEPGVKAEAKR